MEVVMTGSLTEWRDLIVHLDNQQIAELATTGSLPSPHTLAPWANTARPTCCLMPHTFPPASCIANSPIRNRAAPPARSGKDRSSLLICPASLHSLNGYQC